VDVYQGCVPQPGIQIFSGALGWDSCQYISGMEYIQWIDVVDDFSNMLHVAKQKTNTQIQGLLHEASSARWCLVIGLAALPNRFVTVHLELWVLEGSCTS